MTCCESSVIGPDQVERVEQERDQARDLEQPVVHAARRRGRASTMIASCTPVQAIVHASPSRRAARMLNSADVAALVHDLLLDPLLGAVRLHRLDRAQRALERAAEPAQSAPAPPSWPSRSPASRAANRIVTTTTAAMVGPSRTRSSTPISTSVPTSITVELMMPDDADEAASLSRTVSLVTRVTSSPLGRRGDRRHGGPQVAADHRRARAEHDALAHRAQDPPLQQEDERAAQRQRQQQADGTEQRFAAAERVQHPLRDQRARRGRWRCRAGPGRARAPSCAHAGGRNDQRMHGQPSEWRE